MQLHKSGKLHNDWQDEESDTKYKDDAKQAAEI